MEIEFKLIEKKHLETIRKWRNSKAVSEYMYSDKKISKEEQIKWFERVSSDKSCIYWVIEFENKPIGLVYITEINQLLNSCHWAFYLGDDSNRGMGIGGKVEYKVMEYVFDVLKLNKLKCEVFEFNNMVVNMHEKFGFRREAFYREHCLKNGKYLNVIGLAMLRSEWIILKPIIYQKVFRKKI